MRIITKTILTIVTILLANACATTPTMKSVAGEYEAVDAGTTYIEVLLENGVHKERTKGKSDERQYKWQISKDGEIHLGNRFGGITVCRVNSEGNLIVVAHINKGEKRRDGPNRLILEKIK